ncbi:helix-turn-helix domain-containing protein [Dactylosporangium sucinum]|uniref:Integrase/transposase n=1 Tax=Dactylosporangium sucinum TaxID=1424081 RepID=A0A917UF48_9ACTN|nr:helix-turn-helix domain-containing protein [Dactylosporangium sucinum]GGM88134.1 integrase/transposase [Dactylosporangium sucinum]
MTGQSVLLQVGARFAFDGEVVEVMQLEGARVSVRDARDRWRTLGLSGFLATATAAGEQVPMPALGTRLAALSAGQRDALTQRAQHVREVLTGYRSGTAEQARAGEPRPEYASDRPMRARQTAKATELGVSERTVRRWVQAYVRDGEAGLLDERQVTGRGSTVDPRWEQACRMVMAELVPASTPTTSAVLRLVDARLDEQYGAGVVPRPSPATAYRQLARLAKGTNAVRGSAKGRRSIADRPKGVYGRLRATRPGEYVILDTQSLDVFAMEPVTCRWLPCQLTVAQDLFTRCIIGLRVTPVSTKAVDVAGVLHQAVLPQALPDTVSAEGRWPYHGLPQQVVFTENQPAPDGPVYAPETLVVDHGKAFLSAHIISVCTRLGISIQPAQPRKPTDKPTVERFFKTLREGLIQYLPAYKGPDVYSRGVAVEDAAFFYVHELEDAIREWTALVYHRSKHDGLAVPEWPHLDLSPNDMYEVGLARAGLLRIPASADLAYDFLDTVARTIQRYGVEVNGLRYNGCGLDGYRNTRSPYGGALNGKWPIRVNPDDVRYVWFQDPADHRWHRLDWEHAAAIGAPFSFEAAQYARRLPLRADRLPEPAAALGELLARWDTGMVTDRRERRMAARLGAENAALATPDSPAEQAVALPTVAQLTNHRAGLGLRLVADPASEPEPLALTGDDDEDEEIFDDPDEDFYADAFEVIE